jgi:hypothetical protein
MEIKLKYPFPGPVSCVNAPLFCLRSSHLCQNTGFFLHIHVQMLQAEIADFGFREFWVSQIESVDKAGEAAGKKLRKFMVMLARSHYLSGELGAAALRIFKYL